MSAHSFLWLNAAFFWNFVAFALANVLLPDGTKS